MPSAQAKKAEHIQEYKVGVIGMGQALTMDERCAVTEGIGQWATTRDDVDLEAVKLGERDASLYGPVAVEPGMVVLYLHGGRYVMGSLASHGRLMAHLAHHCSTPVYGLNFRRAPENPYPAALDDARSAYSALLEMGWNADKAVIALLREAGESAPAGGILLSSWLDLALTSDSMERLAARDPWTTRPTLETFGKLYAGDIALDDPVSPVYMDFAGLPSILTHVSASEMLIDDATRARDRSSTAGAGRMTDVRSLIRPRPVEPRGRAWTSEDRQAVRGSGCSPPAVRSICSRRLVRQASATCLARVNGADNTAAVRQASSGARGRPEEVKC